MLNDSSLFDIEDNGGVTYELAGVFDARECGSNKKNGVLYAKSNRYDSIACACQLQMPLICVVSSAISNTAPMMTAPTIRISQPTLTMPFCNGGTANSKLVHDFSIAA